MPILGRLLKLQCLLGAKPEINYSFFGEELFNFKNSEILFFYELKVNIYIKYEE